MLRSAAQASVLSLVFVGLIMVAFLPRESVGFQIFSSTTAQPKSSSRQQSQLGASIIDPSDISAILTTAQQHTAGDLPISSLSALLTSSIVAPSAEAMVQLQGAASATALPAAKAASIQGMLPGAGDAMQAQAQQALDSGWKVMDASKFVHGGQASMPGFSETKSVVAPHLLPGPSDESVTMREWPDNMFAMRMEYVTTMLRAIRKLPYVALGYALLEFFFLRNDVDIYKEDVEDDPAGVFAETVSDASVRFAIFFGLALVTYVIS